MRCTPSPCTPCNSSSPSCCWTRARFGLAASHLHMFEPRVSLTRSHFAGSASLLSRLAFRRTPWLRSRYGYRVPSSRAKAFHRYSSCACRCSARRTPASPAHAHGPALLRPSNTCTHRQLSRVTARTLAPPARCRSRSCRSSSRTRSTPVRLHRAVSAHAGAVRANSAAVVARALCSRAPIPPVPPSSCSLSLAPQLLHSPGVHAPAPANSERQNRAAPPRQRPQPHATSAPSLAACTPFWPASSPARRLLAPQPSACALAPTRPATICPSRRSLGRPRSAALPHAPLLQRRSNHLSRCCSPA
jgi:hypothetical protein